MIFKSDESLQYIAKSVKRPVIPFKFQKPKSLDFAKNVRCDYLCLLIEQIKAYISSICCIYCL